MSDSTSTSAQAHGSVAPGDAAKGPTSLFPIDGTVPFDQTTPEQENTYHQYTGNAIPWVLRGIWILFWCYAIVYVILWLIPSLQSELLSPP
jgi:hypothetical protein